MGLAIPPGGINPQIDEDMKRHAIIALAAIATISSCTKDGLFPDKDGREEIVTGTAPQVFNATMEGFPATRATLDGMTPSWEVGDVISIDGHSYTAKTAGTGSTFEGTGAGEAIHHAYFPAGLYNGGSTALPAVQTYVAGKFDMPMYAESDNTTLSFKNICAVLAIKVTSADITTLKAIKVASDKKMNGTFTVSEDRAVMSNNGTNEVVLKSSETLTLTSGGTTFYIAIPAQNYMYLNIYLSSDGETYTRAMATKKAAGLGDIARSKIFSIDYETNAFQLYANGPYWATCNIGASTDTGSGKYYAWANTTGYSPSGGTFSHDFAWKNCKYADNGDYGVPNGNKKVFTKYIPSDKGSKYWANSGNPDNKTTIESNDDAAKTTWGSNWRMPTKEEFEALISNAASKSWTADYNGTGGYTFTGNGNTMFLPAGYAQDDRLAPGGDYWTSTLYASLPEYAYYLSFGDGHCGVYNMERRYGLPIRAVLQ